LNCIIVKIIKKVFFLKSKQRHKQLKVKNRIKRLSSILPLLSSGYDLSTPKLAEQFGVTIKIIQSDFKEYLIPLFCDKTIYYDYISKTYKAKNNFLAKTLYSVEELAVISILKSKAKDKNLDDDLFEKTNSLFHKFEDELLNSFYQKSSVEKIDDFKCEIIEIKNAIESKNKIECFYNKKIRIINPLKILNLEGYWYLIVLDNTNDKIKTFHLNSIKEIKTLHNSFEYDEDIINTFDNAITAYYKPKANPILVQLFVEENIVRYFKRKPISKTQRIIKEYQNGSCDIEIIVTDFMEIIPTIQRYIPFVKVIEPVELKNEIKKNIEKYVRDCD
jgi:predicted DNA-binding transcriptional regulator YafY